jgi:hypothetical protein
MFSATLFQSQAPQTRFGSKDGNRTKWVKKVLLATSNKDNEEVSARWLMQHVGYC